MEYNPVDKLHYVCYFQDSTDTYYLATIDREVAITQGGGRDGSGGPDNFAVTITPGGSNAEKGFNDITSQLSLTIASPFEFSLQTNNTSRSSFIGTAAAPLWALCFSRLANDNTASDIYYSTDLKTWKSSASFYSPADYSALVGDSTVKSNSGIYEYNIYILHKLYIVQEIQRQIQKNQEQLTMAVPSSTNLERVARLANALLLLSSNVFVTISDMDILVGIKSFTKLLSDFCSCL
jgi:hypothetical protein